MVVSVGVEGIGVGPCREINRDPCEVSLGIFVRKELPGVQFQTSSVQTPGRQGPISYKDYQGPVPAVSRNDDQWGRRICQKTSSDRFQASPEGHEPQGECRIVLHHMSAFPPRNAACMSLITSQ